MTKFFIDYFPCQYHWAYMAKSGEYPGVDACWVGQKNGICGAALPGQISFTFGPHTGSVKLQVMLVDVAPPLHSEWEEVVEAPFVVEYAAEHAFIDFDGDLHGELLFLKPGEYRVRFCAVNYAITEVNTSQMAEEQWQAAIESEYYELVIWPEAIRPDEIIRVKSAHAAYWHKSRQEHEAKRLVTKN